MAGDFLHKYGDCGRKSCAVLLCVFPGVFSEKPLQSSLLSTRSVFLFCWFSAGNLFVYPRGQVMADLTVARKLGRISNCSKTLRTGEFWQVTLPKKVLTLLDFSFYIVLLPFRLGSC